MAPHRALAIPPVPPPSPGHFDIVVLGSGVSTATPQMSHVLRRACNNPKTAIRRVDGLAVCEEAFANPGSKNRRLNVSLLLRFVPATGDRARHIMVDAGKTMRAAIMAAFPGLGAHAIDALLLTHGHADAMLGLDDLRDLQMFEEVREEGILVGYKPMHGMGPVRILSNKATLDRVRETFPYLCGSVDFARPGVLKRRVAWLEMEEVSDDNAAVEVAGLPVRFFPVWHGGTYISLGFAFGRKPGGGHPFVYISDVNEVPPDTMAWLKGVAKVGIDLLVVDALHRQNHVSHFSLSDALAFLLELRPKRALLVGMSSCEMGDHDEVNEELAGLHASEGLDVQLAYDGMLLGELPAGC